MPKNVFAERGFIQILGPNPAIVTGDEKAWDGEVLEACDIFKDNHTYYWYYHAIGKDKKRWPKAYRIGVAMAPTPLGPWRKYEGNPVLDHGPDGSWEDEWVACGTILKEGHYNVRKGTERYYMFYSGTGSESEGVSVGLAYADNPLGPWRKYEGNPIIEDFGYVGGVVKVGGKYYMFNEHPIGPTDHGPFALAVADRPEGPWRKYEGNPVLPTGDWGAWDATGFSEAKVVYHEGIFHCFYSACMTQKLESIGYAYSFDGYKWTKYEANPVVVLERTPDASAFAEVQALIEPPFIFLYHTLRYISRGGEDLGIHVLSIDPHFRLSMPVLILDSLGPKAISELGNCCPIGLDSVSSLALTTECKYHADAKKGLRIHVASSYDGINYDDFDLYVFDVPVRAGKTVRKTVELSPKVRFVKVMVENLDDSHEATSIKVTATLGN